MAALSVKFEPKIAPLITPQSYAKQQYSLPLVKTIADWQRLQQSLMATRLDLKAPTAVVGEPTAASAALAMDLGSTTTSAERWHNVFRQIQNQETKRDPMDLVKFLGTMQDDTWRRIYIESSPFVLTIEQLPDAILRKSAFDALFDEGCFGKLTDFFSVRKQLLEYKETFEAPRLSSFATKLSSTRAPLPKTKWSTETHDRTMWQSKLMSRIHTAGNEVQFTVKPIGVYEPTGKLWDQAQITRRRFVRMLEDCFVNTFLLKLPAALQETVLSQLETSYANSNPLSGGFYLPFTRHILIQTPHHRIRRKYSYPRYSNFPRQ